MAYGTEAGLVIVDVIQKALLLIVTTQDLYGNLDPSQRSLRSPKRYEEKRDNEDKARSPSVDQVKYLPLSYFLSFNCSISNKIIFKIFEFIRDESQPPYLHHAYRRQSRWFHHHSLVLPGRSRRQNFFITVYSRPIVLNRKYRCFPIVHGLGIHLFPEISMPY